MGNRGQAFKGPPQRRRPREAGVVEATVAEWTGLEPATPGVTGRYSDQLNYHSAWPVASSLMVHHAGPKRHRDLASPRGFEPLLQP